MANDVTMYGRLFAGDPAERSHSEETDQIGRIFPDGELNTLKPFRTLGMGAFLLIGSAAITMGLVFTMITLIADEFTPQDRLDLQNLDIHPSVEDVPVMNDRKPPAPLDPIEAPPAPPIVTRVATAKPGTPIVDVLNPNITFDPTTMLKVPVTYQAVDRDPEPLFRIPPTMPPRADRSGHCRVAFDISADGQTYNVRSVFCSQRLFERAAVRAVQKWTYRAKIQDGLAVPRTGLETRLSFELVDDAGQILPE